MISFREFLKHPLTYWILAFILIISAGVIGYKFTYEGMENVSDVKEEEEEVTQLSVSPEETQEFAKSPAPTGITEITPEDLLPRSDEVRDFEKKFKTGKEGLDRNFIAAGHHIGINTVSGSLRNANLSIRSDPVIPRVDVGPWGNSTILPSDLGNRKKFEIGSSV